MRWRKGVLLMATRNPAFTNWGNGSLSHYLQGFIYIYIPGGCLGFLLSTVWSIFCLGHMFLFGLGGMNELFLWSKSTGGIITTENTTKNRPKGSIWKGNLRQFQGNLGVLFHLARSQLSTWSTDLEEKRCKYPTIDKRAMGGIHKKEIMGRFVEFFFLHVILLFGEKTEHGTWPSDITITRTEHTLPHFP